MDADVDILAVKIDRLMRRRNLHINMAIERMKTGQTGHHPANGQSGRQFDPQGIACRLGFQAAGLDVDFIEQLAKHGGIERALARCFNSTTQATAEGQAKPLLKLGHVPADRTLSHAQFTGGFGEAAIAGCGFKSPERIQGGK